MLFLLYDQTQIEDFLSFSPARQALVSQTQYRIFCRKCLFVQKFCFVQWLILFSLATVKRAMRRIFSRHNAAQHYDVVRHCAY